MHEIKVTETKKSRRDSPVLWILVGDTARIVYDAKSSAKLVGFDSTEAM
ncbi:MULTISPECIES: hypothetical protein [Vibrio]|nr:hypothetical protein [Vibrio cyclitrophicus]